ncbi:hypothetical protein [Acinetobacter phage Ab69]|nr:hypothetical protein [Acinetobacter phage Ab69]
MYKCIITAITFISKSLLDSMILQSFRYVSSSGFGLCHLVNDLLQSSTYKRKH